MAKRYKGVATIELTDIRTGKKQVQVEENLVTNAVYNIVSKNPFGAVNYGNTRISHLMSGILLFDEALTENVNNTRIPKIPLTWAGNTVNTSGSSVRGSINNVASHLNDNGFTFVWEWNTTQGNGTYKSIALTHPSICNDDDFADGYTNGANGVIGDDMGTTITSGSDPNFVNSCMNSVFIDTEKNEWWKVVIDTDFQTVSLNRGKRGIFKIPTTQRNICTSPADPWTATNVVDNGVMCRHMDSYVKKFDTQVLYPYGSSSSGLNAVTSLNYHDGHIYIISLGYNTSIMRLCDIDLASVGDGTFSATLQDLTVPDIKFNGRSAKSGSATTANWIFLSCTPNRLCLNYPYVYAKVADHDNTLAKINITDVTDVTIIENVSTTPAALGNCYYGGVRLGNFFYSDSGYVISLNEDKLWNGYAQGIPQKGYGYSMTTIDDEYILINGTIGNGEQSLRLNPFYMATINNVNTFTKTNTQTMKITYTITEVDEEGES